MKLSGARTPYFDAQPVRAGAVGRYEFISTRNNNFSNRGQKGTLIISPGNFEDETKKRSLNDGDIAGIRALY